MPAFLGCRAVGWKLVVGSRFVVRNLRARSAKLTLLSGFMALVVFAAFAPQATWAAVPTQSAAAGTVSAAFHAASVESGVPEELLLAIGFVNTRWRMETSEDHGVGIMHLIHDPQAE